MLRATYHKVALSLGVTLHRYYLGASPNSLGGPAEWQARIEQIAKRLGSKLAEKFFAGLDIHVHDMDDETLDEEVRNGQANLQDLNPATPDPDTGAGAFWDRDRLRLAVFHKGWKANASPSPYPITDDDLRSAMDTLAHELGHYLAWLIGFGKLDGPFIQKELTRIILPLLPGQCKSVGEDIAETFRAGFGCRRTFGTFSDGKPYTMPAKLRMALLAALPLHERLRQKVFTDLTLTAQGYEWREWGMVTKWILIFPYLAWEVTGSYRMDAEGNVSRI